MGVSALKASDLFSGVGRAETGSGRVTDQKELGLVLNNLVCIVPAKGCDPRFTEMLRNGHMLHQDVKGHLDEDLVNAVAAGVAPPQKKATFGSIFKRSPTLAC